MWWFGWRHRMALTWHPSVIQFPRHARATFQKKWAFVAHYFTISPLSSIYYLVNRKQCGNVCYLLCLCDCDCERQLWWLLVNQLGPQIGTSERKKPTNCRIFLITLGNDFLSDIRTLIQTNPQQICGLPSGSVGFCLGPCQMLNTFHSLLVCLCSGTLFHPLGICQIYDRGAWHSAGIGVLASPPPYVKPSCGPYNRFGSGVNYAVGRTSITYGGLFGRHVSTCQLAVLNATLCRCQLRSDK